MQLYGTEVCIEEEFQPFQTSKRILIPSFRQNLKGKKSQQVNEIYLQKAHHHDTVFQSLRHFDPFLCGRLVNLVYITTGFVVPSHGHLHANKI